jgi:hypothetical protein
MPPPDRPRKPASPARGGTPYAKPTPKDTKPAAKPSAPRPVKSTKSAPTPAPIPLDELVREWELRLSPLVWWGIVLAVGLASVLCFEVGFSAGERRSARMKADSQAEYAEAKPADVPRQPSIESKPTPKPASSTTPPKEPKSTVSSEPPKKTTPPAPSVPPPSKDEPIKPTEPTKPTESTVTLKFEKDIFPIFQAKCTSCHGGLSKKGGLDLRTLASTARGGNSGPGMKPGRPDDSPVWQSLKANEMPPSNKPQLTAEEKQLILKWIAGGGK